MSKKKTYLKERMKPASRGRYLNAAVLLPKLEEATAWPLNELLNADTLEYLEDTRKSLSITSPFEIYQDVVNFISKYWQDPTDPKNHGICSTYYEYAGYIEDLIIAFVNCYINELRRRNNSEAYIYVKNAASFPGFSIPLPQLMQAGALRCSNTALAKKFSNAYQNEFLVLMKKCPSFKESATKYLKKQPCSHYFFDSVTMTFIAADAANHDLIRNEEAVRYYFDILILPYVVQKESDDKITFDREVHDQPDHHDEGFLEADNNLRLYIEDEEEFSFTDSNHLENFINEICRTGHNCICANHETYDNWIMCYPMTDTPYSFCGDEDWREELRDTLSSIIKIILYGNCKTEFEDTDVKNHLFGFRAYAVDDNGNAVNHDFTSEDMKVLINQFKLSHQTDLVTLVCHKDEQDCIEHIHGLFYFRADKPWPGMTRIKEILT